MNCFLVPLSQKIRLFIFFIRFHMASYIFMFYGSDNVSFWNRSKNISFNNPCPRVPGIDRPLPVSLRCGTGLIRLQLKPLSKYWRPHVLHSVSPPTYTGRFVLSWLFVFIASSLHNYKNYAGSRCQGFRSCRPWGAVLLMLSALMFVFS